MKKPRRSLSEDKWEGGEPLEITIKGDAQEIAALVLAVQERRFEENIVQQILDRLSSLQKILGTVWE